MSTTPEPTQHVWGRFIVMPCNVFMGEDKEPYIEYDKDVIQGVLDDPDKAVACIVCHKNLDEAWMTNCEGIDASQFVEADNEPSPG